MENMSAIFLSYIFNNDICDNLLETNLWEANGPFRIDKAKLTKVIAPFGHFLVDENLLGKLSYKKKR